MSIRILLIDDHPLFLDGLVAVLRRFNRDIRIRVASNAEDGVALAQTADFDLGEQKGTLPNVSKLSE